MPSQLLNFMATMATNLRTEVNGMPVDIQTTNDRELLTRKSEILSALRNSTERPAAVLQDFATLACVELFDKPERSPYDERSIVQMLLGEADGESA